jgi:adenylyltransferase/sulfurtransferase
VFVVCRRGNDSQLAVKLLCEHGKAKGRGEKVVIRDIIGGLVAWSETVDPLFPKY